MSITRRQVLRGAAGFTLAMPLLPSLLPRAAWASSEGQPPRFIAFATEHGGVWQDHLYPSDATLTESRAYAAGYDIRRGDLGLQTSGGRASLSAVLSADATRLTPAIAARMNVLRGLDWPFYLGHHRGGHLGNPAENDGNGGDGKAVQEMPRPTIDQVLAWSSSFYPDTSGILERSLVLGGRHMSTGWSNPAEGTGTLSSLPSEFDSLALFSRVFRRGETTREPVVDLVLEDYRRLRQSDRRLAAGDRRRLDEHMERLYELERKLGTQVSCDDLDEPLDSSRSIRRSSGYAQDPARQAQAWQLMNDVLVAALVCDTCRIVTARCTDTFSTYAGDWHQEIAHQANKSAWNAPPALDGPSPHDQLGAGHQRFFEHVFVDLVSKLHAVDLGGGTTLLDACLVQWTHESGPSTHNPLEMPVITAGGASGALSTGHYADYRDLRSPAITPRDDRAVTAHPGLMMNQWLGTALQSMGLDRSEYEQDGWGGYGPVFLSTAGWYAGHDRYGPDVLAVMGERLPFL